MPNFKVLEVFGEGKTDVGKPTAPDNPKTGVVPILVHSLCGRPADMLVKRQPLSFLQGKRMWQKVRFAKQQTFYNGSAGAVFVLDTEGDHKARIAELVQGRDSCLEIFPMAVGAAHPCIEAWLLADAKAIAKRMNLSVEPPVPEKPEELPAPRMDRKNNAKTVLVTCAGVKRAELSAADKCGIASAMKNMDLIRERCPLSFAPFADEVEQRIKPIFHALT